MRDPQSQANLVLTISARTPNGLRMLAGAYAARLEGVSGDEALAVCAGATLNRSHEEHRLLVVGENVDTLAARLVAFRDDATASQARVRVNHVRANPSMRIGAVCRGEVIPGLLAALPEACQQNELLREVIARRAAAIAHLTPWSPEFYCFTHGIDAEVAGEVRRCVALTLEVSVIDALRNLGVNLVAVLGRGTGAMAAAVTNGELAFSDAILALLSGSSGSGPAAAAAGQADKHPGVDTRASFDLLIEPAPGQHQQEPPADLTLLGGSLAPCSFIAGLGELHLAGAELEWTRVWGITRRHVSLPHYPFQRRRFWFDQVGGARSRSEAAQQIADQQPEAAQA